MLRKGGNFTRSTLSKFRREAGRLHGSPDDGDADDDRVDSNSGGSGGKLAEKIAAITDKSARNKAMLKELDRTREDQKSLTDPDARAMARITR